MTGRFEWHITCPKQYAKKVETFVNEVEDATLVFSVITGCPILGQGQYCYVTGYQTNDIRALGEVIMITTALEGMGVPVLRSKIENIIYDTKTNVNLISEVHTGPLQ